MKDCTNVLNTLNKISHNPRDLFDQNLTEDKLIKQFYSYRDEHINKIINEQKKSLKNIIASVIGNREDVFVKLDIQDVIGIRDTLIKVYEDEYQSKEYFKKNNDYICNKIITKLKEEGYSVEFKVEKLNYKNKKICCFRCSSIPIKKGENNGK